MAFGENKDPTMCHFQKACDAEVGVLQNFAHFPVIYAKLLDSLDCWLSWTVDKTRPKLFCLGFSDCSSKRDFSSIDGCGSLPDSFALQPQASIGDTTAHTYLSALGIPFPTTEVLAPLLTIP